MRSRCLVLLALLLVPALGRAQVDATRWQSGTVDIDQGWKEQDGDNPRWAQPCFDDSQWQTVELDNMGPAVHGWHWFRLHVKLAPGHPHLHLLFAGGNGTYELYINGQKADDPKILPFYEVTRPTEQVIPVPDNTTNLLLALRTHTSNAYQIYHLPLFLTAALGTPAAIDNERAAMQSVRLYTAIPTTAINLLLILAGIAALALYRAQGGHAEYRWLGLYLLLLGLSNGLAFVSGAGVIPLAWNYYLGDPLIYVFTILQIEFTFSFAGQRVGRAWRMYECLLPAPLILMVLMLAGKLAGDPYLLAEAVIILPAGILLPVLLWIWYRRGNREAGWLILPSLLPVATQALFDIGFVAIYTGWQRLTFLDNPIAVGPVSLQLADTGDFLFVLAIGVVMFFRFTRVNREKAWAAAEFQAAREIQQRLVPASLPQVAGYVLQAAYSPAEEVGGDFYQVLEQGDNGTLIVVGDVSGKGLPAAMTVSAIIGSLRMMAACDPAEVLRLLNESLCGNVPGGFVTCLASRLHAEGSCTVANAGHLAPYRNGEELPVSPGLPLGIAPGVDYVATAFHLAPGDTLTLLSDGVVEARNPAGELFGFDRTRQISTRSAEQIARAAQAFGQQDDITVLTISPAPVAAPAWRSGSATPPSPSAGPFPANPLYS
ncbi:MAG TPA: PP2C family protein-serine/threonine phosphatase [Acidobacteriaceae bacterium]|nr:PP2C family protein-serine/threonine phosphatase [Acidobacteriaceae bacterium]